MLLDERADLLVRQPISGGINRQDEPAVCGLARLVGIGEHEKLPRHELASVIVAHRPRDQEQLSLTDRPLEKRLPGPRTLEHSGVVL